MTHTRDDSIATKMHVFSEAEAAMRLTRGSVTERRAFFGGVGAMVATFGARVFGSQPAGGGDDWHPSKHAKDEWLDRVPGKHRLFLDVITADGLRRGLLFAANYFGASRTGYGLKYEEVAVIVGLRHDATAFA